MKEPRECQGYVTHLRAEHRRLHGLVHAIEQQLMSSSPLPSASDRQELLLELSSLRTELQRHFEEEESGGCLEEAVTSSPALFHEATELEHQHPELLAELDRAIAEAKDVNVAPSIEKLRDVFRSFFRKLRAHEAAENRMLSRGFGMELDEIE